MKIQGKVIRNFNNNGHSTGLRPLTAVSLFCKRSISLPSLRIRVKKIKHIQTDGIYLHVVYLLLQVTDTLVAAHLTQMGLTTSALIKEKESLIV